MKSFFIIVLLVISKLALAQSDGICGYRVSKINKVDSVSLMLHINNRKTEFSKRWMKNNKQLGRDSVRSILSKMDIIYVPMYAAKTTFDSTIVLYPSDNPISDLFFVYDNYEIGNYNQHLYGYQDIYSVSETRKSYGKIVSYTNYAKLDKLKIEALLCSKNGIFNINRINDFTINDYEGWYTCDENGGLIKVERFASMLQLRMDKHK